MGMNHLVPSTTPQQSSRGFVAPSAMPIKKTPDITEIIGEEEKVQSSRFKVQEEEIEVKSDNNVIVPEQKDESGNDEMINLREPMESASSACNFEESWRTLFNHVFASVPTIYIPLKETLPEIENNIIKVTVKNDVQKEHFEAKTRDVLEYLRTHFDEKIEDVVVVANEQLETKKIIYDVKEKLQNFKEQNPEIDDFLQILELKIKDWNGNLHTQSGFREEKHPN